MICAFFRSIETKTFAYGAVEAMNKKVEDLNRKLLPYSNQQPENVTVPHTNQSCQLWSLEKIISASRMESNGTGFYANVSMFLVAHLSHVDEDK